MSSKRKDYHVDDRSKKAATFFVACEPNPDTRLSIPAAMRAKGYSEAKSADQILVQQVHHDLYIRTREIVDNGAYFNGLPMPPRLDHTYYLC
jgi:hypothetical protein